MESEPTSHPVGDNNVEDEPAHQPVPIDESVAQSTCIPVVDVEKRNTLLHADMV